MSTPEFLYQIEYGNPISSNEDSTLYERRLIQKNLDGSMVEKTWQEQVPKQTRWNLPSKESQ
jgi:hypothetical protein